MILQIESVVHTTKVKYIEKILLPRIGLYGFLNIKNKRSSKLVHNGNINSQDLTGSKNLLQLRTVLCDEQRRHSGDTN
jgi:hypothetical protein